MDATKTLPEILAEICASDAPLGERLAIYAARLKETGSPMGLEYGALVERLRSGHAGAGAPAIGEAMPPFLLPDRRGHLVGLEAILADGPAVISFNRGHWCSFCRIELTTLAAAEGRVAAAGARIVSIMPDRHEFVRLLPSSIVDRITILSDVDNSYAMSLGLAIWVGDALAAMMRERSLCLDEFQGNHSWMLPIPATFVVGRDGTVLARHVDPDFRSRMEVADILDALPPADR
ncbi:redoxin domain-containing protein [Elioraea sp.]|uniref:redoxin domain-containing protein n=1 Tax=Elioraea sp. TaxID=2185103 RepID=UPI003F6FEA1E